MEVRGKKKKKPLPEQSLSSGLYTAVTASNPLLNKQPDDVQLLNKGSSAQMERELPRVLMLVMSP